MFNTVVSPVCNVDSGFKGMSCLMPVNPFKPENSFTSQSANPFASPLDPSVNISSGSHRFHYAKTFESESQQDTYSTYLFTHCQKFHKLIKNPADYDGTRSLSDYLKHFERCSVVNGWSQEEAALLLAARLREEAQKVLNGMSDSDCRNYAKIVDKLEVRCGVEKHCDLH